MAFGSLRALLELQRAMAARIASMKPEESVPPLILPITPKDERVVLLLEYHNNSKTRRLTRRWSLAERHRNAAPLRAMTPS